jgi:hypothetical protein
MFIKALFLILMLVENKISLLEKIENDIYSELKRIAL